MGGATLSGGAAAPRRRIPHVPLSEAHPHPHAEPVAEKLEVGGERDLSVGDIRPRLVDREPRGDVPEGVSATYGIFGGRRTKEREDIHYAATIDDLITRASKNCTASKPGRAEPIQPFAPSKAPETPAPRPPARLKIKNVTISTTETEVKASVVLSRGDEDHQGEAEGYSSGGGASLRIVAEAAAKAACESLESGCAIVVEGVTTHRVGTEDEVVSVATTFIGPRLNVRHVGSAFVRRGDPHRTAVAALLASVNRLLELQGD